MKMLKRILLVTLTLVIVISSMDHLSNVVFANDINENTEMNPNEEANKEESINEETTIEIDKEKPQEQVNEEEKEQDKEEKNQLLQQNEKSNTNLLTLTDNFDKNTEMFSVTVGLNIPVNNTKNRLVIHLPKYVELADPIRTDNIITSVDVTGDSDLETGTTYVLNIADSTDRGLIFDKTIGISQKKYMEQANSTPYTIKVSFQSDQVAETTQSKDYVPKLDADKEVIGHFELNKKLPNAESGMDYKEDNTYSVVLDIPFLFDPTDPENKVILSADMFDNMTPKTGQLNGDDTYTIAITESMYNSYTRKLTIPLDVDVDFTKMNNPFTESHTFDFKGTVQFANKRKYEFSYKLSNYKIEFVKYNEFEANVSASSNDGYIARLNSRSGGASSNDALGFVFDYTVKSYFNNDGEYIGDNVQAKDLKLTEKKVYTRDLPVTYSFTIPEELEWRGDAKFFDDSTRTVTVDQTVIDNFPDGIYSYIEIDYFGMSSLPLVIKDIKKINEPYTITNMQLKFDNEVLNREQDLEVRHAHLFSSVLGNPIQLSQSSLKNLKAGEQNIEIEGINIKRLYDYWYNVTDLGVSLALKKDYTDPQYGIHYNGNTIKESEIYEINRIVAKRTIAANDKFKYKTNLSPDTWQEWIIPEGSDTDPELILKNGEYLLAYEVELKTRYLFDLSMYEKEYEYLKFYGNVKDRSDYPSTIHEFNPAPVVIQHKDGNVFPNVSLDTKRKLIPISNDSYDISLSSVKIGRIEQIYDYINGYKPKTDIYPEQFVTMKGKGDSLFGGTVKYKLSDDLKGMRAIGLKLSNTTHKFKSITYTTNKNPNSVTKTNVNDFQISDYNTEYFTSLEFELDNPGNKDIEFGFFMPSDGAPDTDKLLEEFTPFVGVPTNNFLGGKITRKANQDTLKANNEHVNVVEARYREKEKAFGTISAGNTIKRKIKLDTERFYSNYNGFGDSSFSYMYNPTFYIQIPSEFEFVDLSMQGTSLGEKAYNPELSVIQSNGSQYLKIRFYGDESSLSSYFKEFTYSIDYDNAADHEDDVNDWFVLTLKAKEFAKPGSKNEALNVYVDIAESNKKIDQSNFSDKSIGVWPTTENTMDSISGAPGNFDTTTFYDEELGKDVKVTTVTNPTEVSYTIAQIEDLRSVVSANLPGESTKTDLSVRSNEAFHANINLFNGFTYNLEDFTMYVPVAREGESNGAGGTWDWSAELLDAGLDQTGTLNVSYSTNPNPTMNKLQDGKEDPAGMYTGTVANLADVTMVKISASSLTSGQLVSLQAKIKNKDAKTKLGEQEIEVLGKFSYRNPNTNIYISNQTNKVKVRLTDTTVKGTAFVDANEDGIWDSTEGLLENVAIKLYDQNGTLKKESTTGKNGAYEFIVSEINAGDYIEVDHVNDYQLTYANVQTGEKNKHSYFDQTTRRATPTLENVEYLNVGFIEAPEIILNPSEYTIKVNKGMFMTVTGLNLPLLTYESKDPSIARVNTITGQLTGVSVGETSVEVFYITKSGLKVSKTAKITVVSNDAPVISAPETLVMNVGDAWDPLDPAIVDGLDLSDDHDPVDYRNLKVSADSVPVGSRFLFFFKTKNTGKITTAGTYEVTYVYEDADNNETTKKMKVKVNGLPVIKYKGTEVTDANIGDYPLYYRAHETLDAYQDMKAYYAAASDTIGAAPVETEINPNDTNTGIFRIQDTMDSDGNPIAGEPQKAGKYKGTYYVKTPSQAKSDASMMLDRTLYVRGMMNISADSISYPAENNPTSFATWDEFYQKFGQNIRFSANVDTTDRDGNISTIDLANTVKIFNMNDNEITDFSTVDFSLPNGTASKDIHLRLKVNDEGKNWDNKPVYGEKTAHVDIVITVQNQVGQAPQITTTNIERITTDEVRDTTVSDKNLISKEAMDDAIANHKNPLYDRLMNDVVITDDKDISNVTRSIVSIERTSGNKGTYDPKNITDLKEMFTTVGTYKITYEAIDGDKNRTVAERMLYVASPTYFVQSIGTGGKQDVPFMEKEEMLEGGPEYIPSGVVAYHIDADEVTKHETTVIAGPNVDVSNPGTYAVEFKTSHHYQEYPYGGTRSDDTITRRLLVHGSVKFEGDLALSEDYFVNNIVDLTRVKAYYLKASETVSQDPVKTPVDVSNSTGKTELTMNVPGKKEVEFSAGVPNSSVVTRGKLIKTYNFYGLPNIASASPIRVPEDATNQEIQALIAKQLQANVEGPDGIIDLRSRVQYDFTDVNDASDPRVYANVWYAVNSGGYISKGIDINIQRVTKPVIEANDIVYHVGDTVNLKDGSGLNVISDQTVNLDDVKVETKVPVDGNGKASQAGTYKVTFTYTDDVAQKATKEILVKVHGKPEFEGIDNLEKRVGDNLSIWDKVKVKWLKAPDQEGAASMQEFNYENAANHGAVLELQDMKDEFNNKPADYLNTNTPGYYSGVFYAKTPTGAEIREKHTLLLHGAVQLQANNITVSKNETKPADFLQEFKDLLQVQASVDRAYTDRKVQTIDLSKQVSANADDLNAIQWGKLGMYRVKLHVSDTHLVNSTSDEKTIEITVNIVDVVNKDEVATIETPQRHRVKGDPIGLNNAGATDISDYLTKQPKVTFPTGSKNSMSTIELKEFVKVKEDGTKETIDVSNNEALKNALNEVGQYDATIEFTDTYKNKQTVTQKWNVAGESEFGIGDSDDTFVPLGKFVEIRQRTTQYDFDGIRVRHMDANGKYHYMPINVGTPIDVQDVKVHNLQVSAIHHYPYYEDDPSQPRGEDQHAFKLLVQGRIQVSGHDVDISTRINSNVDALQNVTATFEKIDRTGNTIITESADLVAETLDTTSIGHKTIKISAIDRQTSAPENVVEVTRNVYVAGIPTIQNNDYFSVSKGATNDEVLAGLHAIATYVEWDGTTQNVNANDITIDTSHVDTSKPGKKYKITITVNYDDNGNTKTITKDAHVYVLNDPSAVVEIPSGIYLKDMDATYAGEKVDVRLRTNVDEDPTSVPKVKITTDQEINLTYGNDVYKAQIYDLNDNLYDGIAPILELKHGEQEEGSFYIKTLRDKNKALGNYTGILNFKFGYEGK